MKKIFIHIILLFTATLYSCQEETVDIQNPSDDEAFTSKSEIANQIKRVTYKDGSDDNIITGGSCISLELPVTVIVNGNEIIVNSEDDYEVVEKIIDRYDDDDDEINIVFPVTVILSDHSEIIINDEEALEDLVDECIEEGFDDDIECIDFEYPLEVTIYATQNQFLENITIDTDKNFHLFIDNLEDDYFVSLAFPLTMILSDGSTVEVNNNIELEELIDDSEDTCDEDDDMNFNDDYVDTEEIDSLLISGQWEITYFFDENDQTELFNNWIFNFGNDELLIATKDADSMIGSWESYGDTGTLELDIEFEDEEGILNLLIEEWEVVEYSDVNIELENHDDENIPTVIFEKL
ncbi:hypothetical protein [Mangrovivirga cuniculi]|uniref:Lipocalin-like domain-containing protein n=1 Tax=Mangrovivirga cuniculi TaxID=2715131 RepID=A0A4D7JWQ5_9BACT|nr:hypothetical protein [Mangrovivirga cuniculi]QCK15235.1 hypothetical protein DCC35_11000 [Mangrovivirga cuniculi]